MVANGNNPDGAKPVDGNLPSRPVPNRKHPRASIFWIWTGRIAAFLAIAGALYSGWKFGIAPTVDWIQEVSTLPSRVKTLEDETVIPIPSPISLGFGLSRTSPDAVYVDPERWVTLPGHDEATIDWRYLPSDMEVYVEAFMEVTTTSSGWPVYGNARLLDTSTRETAVHFDRLEATRVATGVAPPVQRLQSSSLPRRNTVVTYRLEVSGGPNVLMSGYGQLRFRRIETIEP